MEIIIDNRIVNDTTFALRLLNFLDKIEVYDLMSEEELEYLQRVAKDLLKHQVNTCTDDAELAYLKRNDHCIPLMKFIKEKLDYDKARIFGNEP